MPETPLQDGAWGLAIDWHPEPSCVLSGTPVRFLVGLAVVLGLCASLVAVEVLPAVVLRVAGVACGHGALLGVALGWAGAPGVAGSEPARGGVVALLAAATALAMLTPWGALGYVAVALWIGWLARDGALASLGFRVPEPGGASLLGAVVGGLLGLHLLLSAERTFGYRLRTDALGAVLGAVIPAIAYDVGANVLATEAFFRGALFGRLLRRWSFAPAAAVATVACVIRYLLDPLLPKHVELVVGAVFYVAVQSLVSAWLLWYSGSLVPGLASGLLFFAAYRLLAIT